MIVVTPDPEDYAQQFQQKQERLAALMAPFSPPTMECHASPPLHYRMRAEFKIWHEGDHSHYAVFDQGRGQPPRYVDQFPVASETINRLMPRLRQTIETTEILRHKLFQVEFLTTSTGDALVTLIYHKPLDEAWQDCAKRLADQEQIRIIGRSRKQKWVLDRDYVEECFEVANRHFKYRQPEGCFSQPNATVCEKMLNWATDVTREASGDLLELYCGNGNFTLPLAQHFKQVLATEISKPLTAVAKHNCQMNNVDNVNFARLSAEEMSQALAGVREFRRLRHLQLANFDFQWVFVDPPRAGLDAATERMVSGFDNILYISCNPDTLVKNLDNLSSTHQLTRLAFFDQFPYTDHMECGVHLQRK